jgi:penicillin-insensitive murein endopeptidase
VIRRLHPVLVCLLPLVTVAAPAAAEQQVHLVKQGETLAEIARRYAVTVRDLERWNEGVRPEALSVRQPIRVISNRQPPSESIGAPWRGRLENGRQLPAHPGYVIRDRARAWATEETIDALAAAFDEVRRRDPRAPRLAIHDLSLRRGGQIDGHRSHRSGRDVDATYYRRGCPRGLCQMIDVAPSRLAVEPQWTLFRSLITRGRAQVIFVDHGLQAALYRCAQRRGATAQQLETWFQWPRPRNVAAGTIRHFPNHRDHFHVRFACPRGDDDCER